nr:hypothetical protein [Bacillaceae bacterium]
MDDSFGAFSADSLSPGRRSRALFFPDGVQKAGKNSEKREGSASPQAASLGALLPAGKQASNQPPLFAEAKTSGKRGAAAENILAGKVPL